MAIEHPSLPTATLRLALSESGFVFDPASGQSFTVNEVGLDILRQLQKTPESNTDAILQYLVQHYRGEEAEIERDLEDFLATLGEQLGLQP